MTFLLRADELRALCNKWIAMEFLSYLPDELLSRWPISCWKKVAELLAKVWLNFYLPLVCYLLTTT